MSADFWLTEALLSRLKPYFPKPRGKPRVDDRKVLSGTIYIQRNGLMWKDAPPDYGPHKTLYNQWKRWSRMGVFATIMTELAAQAQRVEMVMIDVEPVVRHWSENNWRGHLKAHRTAPSLGRKKRGCHAERGRLIGRTKGGMNSKLHVVADAKGRPIRMFLSAGQTNDYIGARALLASIPQAGALLTNRGYDADWFRKALIERGISPCIPSRKGRLVHIPHDAALYRLRHRIENMFARLKDWRRIATRYDRCPILFLSACALAATVMFWL